VLLHLDIIKVFYSPTDAQVNCLKNNFKIYIKTAPTCFGAVTITRERMSELFYDNSLVHQLANKKLW
jgi:hypothetical protein